MAINNSSMWDIMSLSDAPQSWGGAVMVAGFWCLLFACLAGFLAYGLSSFQRYKKCKGFMRWLGNTFGYACYGIITIIFLAIPVGIAYWMYSSAKAGNVMPLWVTGLLIGGYIGIALLGWFTKKVIVDKISSYEDKINKGGKK